MTDCECAAAHRAADLLYPPADPRGQPWPDPVTLGQIRTRLRALADDCAACVPASGGSVSAALRFPNQSVETNQRTR